jgi:hypothetical protein
MSQKSHLGRIQIISDILDAFKIDSRYKVKFCNFGHCYQLFLASTGALLAEFGNLDDKLVEPAFKTSFCEIKRKILSESDKLKYQV